MITQEDRDILRDVGREYLLDVAMKSQVLKNKLTFREHVDLCKYIAEMPYEDVIAVTITEGIKEFESKFKKFLKYSFVAIAGIGASAVTGPIGALVGPPLAMFVLYIFRKLTDTCSRNCLAKIPMSNKRKICRYQCQVDACARIVRDLRSDISKCGQFAKPEKCEKKLRGEYIKWSRRLQSQRIKLHQATLGVEEKERQKRAKELQKKAKAIASSFQIPNSQMLNMLAEDRRFRQLPFKYHIRLYQAVSELKKSDQEEVAVKPPKIDPKKEKMARQALYLGLWILPIPFFNDVVNYIIKKYNFACVGKCASQRKFSQSLCRTQCSYLSAQYGVKMLNSQLSKCSKANNPVKCKKKILGLLEDWKQREVEAKIKFEAKLRERIRAAKQREGIK
jgi:hypothetical protein